MQRGLDRVLGTTIGITGGGDLDLIARKKVYGETTDFLVRVIRDWYYLRVPARLRVNLLFPRKILGPIFVTGESIGVCDTAFPINTHRHSQLPARRSDVTAT